LTFQGLASEAARGRPFHDPPHPPLPQPQPGMRAPSQQRAQPPGSRGMGGAEHRRGQGQAGDGSGMGVSGVPQRVPTGGKVHLAAAIPDSRRHDGSAGNLPFLRVQLVMACRLPRTAFLWASLLILLATGCQKSIDAEADRSIQALKVLAIPEALNDPPYKLMFCIGIRDSVAGLILHKLRNREGSPEWLNRMANYCGIEE